MHDRIDSGSSLARVGWSFGKMGSTLPFRLILASGSPARRELLARAGYSFNVQPSHIDEPDGKGCKDPRTFVQQLAWEKAAAVASEVEEGLVLAADTIGW